MLEGFAYMAVHQNNPERALTLAGAASSLRQTIGAPLRPPEQAKLDRHLWNRPSDDAPVTPRPPKPGGWRGGECGSRKPSSTLWTARGQNLQPCLYSKLDGSTIRQKDNPEHGPLGRRLTERAPGSGSTSGA